jgi:hypothetical protein
VEGTGNGVTVAGRKESWRLKVESKKVKSKKEISAENTELAEKRNPREEMW